MKRELWLDYSRSFACILVAIGHMLMSFQDASILNTGGIVSFFIKFIYHFHVYIFFFCGGYLFQKKFQAYSVWKEYWKNKLIRCFDYLVIYIIFSAITYFIKVLLSGNVNTPVNESFLHTLIRNPINQMWYMYAILVITLFVPVIRSRFSCYASLIIAATAKTIMCIPAVAELIPHPFDYLMNNSIWFLTGSIWAYKKTFITKKSICILLLFFIITSVVVYIYNVNLSFINTLLTLSGMLGTIELIRKLTINRHSMSFIGHIISKYSFQIYLLHTISAAGIRIILLKFNIDNFILHLIMGLFFSFIVPIISAFVAERTRILNVFFFPSKTIAQLIKNKGTDAICNQ